VIAPQANLIQDAVAPVMAGNLLSAAGGLELGTNKEAEDEQAESNTACGKHED